MLRNGMEIESSVTAIKGDISDTSHARELFYLEKNAL
jgi:hypothetical protein